ncbi:MAG: TVP38/TMEM64 family protein [Beijerinckiaceae bacterium]
MQHRSTQGTSSEGAAKGARAALWRWAPLALIALALAGVWAAGLTRYLTFEQLLASRARLAGYIDAHLVLALLLYAGIYIGSVALSLPGALVLTIAGGFLFGGWLGGAVTLVSATIGATLLFLAARTSLGEALTRRAGPWTGKLRDGFKEDAASYLLFLRLVPVFPFWLVNLAPALFGVKLSTFVWTTLAGIAPGTFAFSLAGAGLDSVAAAQRKAYEACVAAGRAGCSFDISPQQLVTRELILAFAAIGLAALIPVALKKFRSRNAKTSAPPEAQ